MKKYFLVTSIVVLTTVFTLNSVYAQKKYVNKAFTWAQQGEKLDTALKALNVAAEEATTKDWAKTYYTYGVLYQAIGNSQDEQFKNLVEYPFIKAFDSYKKAYYMKDGSSFKTTIDASLISLSNAIINKGIEAYNENDFSNAFKYFEKAIEVNQMPIFGGVVDTAIIYNTALMAYRYQNWDGAIKYFNEAIKYNFGKGDTYAITAECYKSKGDTINYLNLLKTGYEKYPSNQGLLGGIINYYLLESNNPDQAFEYLKLARENDPNNPQFYTAEAHLYDKTGNKEEAKLKYLKAIELDPNFFEAYYNLGVLYFNEGVELTDIANQIKDNKKYEEAKLVADKKFEEAIPYIEKSFELHPDDMSIANTLKTLYYRLKMTEKYDKIMEILNK
ncbi:MAG: hypothetical protein A2X13_12765 [Bacteroidetes bacterium GWC2_33_15]|nr:MAG: hypothetical protein A2X10_13930 [Bacteroidetes bacterium GWA2_33_15]OFX50656.1 MAG: hypothetical protein A2X13_12765 [Bacteroidetes bacterium GWC2_33_15]OFX63248.1 MAG: hypothetical protein A2X15_02035 [Bacteroidetes bacterium GWB2_32_14]OFX69805.1 MAG: hypothetical protein A2X14_05440 [Bacteroidetes bacterium GWD2_33_33]HAN19848.1 hypothetical protein [Bacteroidales bacterium]